MSVIRHPSADAFLIAARPLLMAAEAENNLIIGVAEGLARNPSAAKNPYLATVGNGESPLACAVHIPPFKLLLTRANRAPITALAEDAFAAVPDLEGITGPARSAADFAAAWGELSGAQPRVGMQMRIHEIRTILASQLPAPSGSIRLAGDRDRDLLTEWTEVFVADAGIPEKHDWAAIVGSGVKRGRLFVWDDAGPKSMAAWTGKTPNGVRINFVYTPLEFRGKGYATACVSALTRLSGAPTSRLSATRDSRCCCARCA